MLLLFVPVLWTNAVATGRQFLSEVFVSILVSPLLQLSTSHQELPTRPDHCSVGSQQPDCHKAILLQQPSDRLHQTDSWQAATGA